MAEERKIRELTTKQCIIFNMGGLGLSLALGFYGGFSFYFMTYIIGLDALYSGIGSALNALLAALCCILFGYLSDHKKPGRFGKRRPYMLLGAPFVSIFFFMIWYFPDSLRIESIGQIGVAIYYFISVSGYAIFSTYVWTPYTALIPEVSNTDKNRLKISSIGGILSLIGTIAGVLFPLIIKSSFENEEIILFMRYFGFIVSIIVFITIYITFFGVKEPIMEIGKHDSSNLRINPQKEEKITFKAAFLDTLSPLKNRDFRLWQVNNFLFNIALKIPITILLAFVEYVLLIQDSEIMTFVAIILPFVLIGFVFWTKKGTSWGLKKAYLIAITGLTIFLMLCIVFLIPMPDFLKRILGVILITISLVFLISFFILPNPILSKIIDNEIEETIIRQGPFKDENDRYKFSGKFFGMNSLIVNIAAGVASVIMGVILSGRETDPFTLTILMPITGFFVMFIIIVIKKLNLTSPSASNLTSKSK